jgi:hypothetical protein
MGIFRWVAVAAMLVCGVTQAAEQIPPPQGDAAVGVGIICNTSEQAEQFVRLLGTGVRSDQALQAVNSRAKDECACGVATIAYIRDETVHITNLQNKLVQIVRINVVAGFNGAGWQAVSNNVQYAVLVGGGDPV